LKRFKSFRKEACYAELFSLQAPPPVSGTHPLHARWTRLVSALAVVWETIQPTRHSGVMFRSRGRDVRDGSLWGGEGREGIPVGTDVCGEGECPVSDIARWTGRGRWGER